MMHFSITACQSSTVYHICPKYSYEHAKAYCMHQRNAMIEVLLMSTHNICFYGELKKFSQNCYHILLLLNLDIPCLCKHCRSRSVGFFRSQLIWICTVCYSVCEFVSTTWIKQSGWLTVRSGRGFLIYSA